MSPLISQPPSFKLVIILPKLSLAYSLSISRVSAAPHISVLLNFALCITCIAVFKFADLFT